jgi:hypothetical protein
MLSDISYTNIQLLIRSWQIRFDNGFGIKKKNRWAQGDLDRSAEVAYCS